MAATARGTTSQRNTTAEAPRAPRQTPRKHNISFFSAFSSALSAPRRLPFVARYENAVALTLGGEIRSRGGGFEAEDAHAIPPGMLGIIQRQIGCLDQQCRLVQRRT